MRAIGLDGWQIETLEESPRAKVTLPGNNTNHLRTVKATLLRSTYTLEEDIIDSPFTAANFSKVPTDGGTTIVLFLYGLDAKQMNDSAHIIMNHAGHITGAPHLRIRPSTATLAESKDDGTGGEIQMAVPLLNLTKGGRHKGKQRKRVKDDQPKETQTCRYTRKSQPSIGQKLPPLWSLVVMYHHQLRTVPWRHNNIKKGKSISILARYT